MTPTRFHRHIACVIGKIARHHQVKRAMSRIQTVDVFRVLAILAVIALHLARHDGPGAVGTAFDPATFMNLVERFAVPMFFILSGYFWAEKCRARLDYWGCSLALGRRVLLLFAAW